MGYYMTQDDSHVFIPKELFGPALDSVKKIMLNVDKMHGFSFSPQGQTTERYYSWVSTQEVLKAETLAEALYAWRWEAGFDSSGNICDLSFTGEKRGQDEILFEVLAPHVKDGGYISMRGEDGYFWRWLFRDKKCINQSGRVVYD